MGQGVTSTRYIQYFLSCFYIRVETSPLSLELDVVLSQTQPCSNELLLCRVEATVVLAPPHPRTGRVLQNSSRIAHGMWMCILETPVLKECHFRLIRC